MKGYCWTCGWHTDTLGGGALDPATKMCAWCRDHWKPAAPAT